jgi:hypothetical protein
MLIGVILGFLTPPRCRRGFYPAAGLACRTSTGKKTFPCFYFGVEGAI